jgi:hypothetical protein
MSVSTVSTSAFVFPKNGILLKYLEDIVLQCGGREAIQNLTTFDICTQFIQPWTETSQCSYCDFLELQQPGMRVRKANVFISHAWKYLFVDVVDAIQSHFENYCPWHLLQEDEEDAEIVVWIDVFSNNQHLAPDLDFELWCQTFQSAVEEFHYTVLVLAPWKDPIPLTRAWCLFEIYCTAETESLFEIAMTNEEKVSFITEMKKGHCQEVLDTLLSTINAVRSEASHPIDREKIFEMVRKNIGFERVNSMVLSKIREWIKKTTEQELQLLIPTWTPKGDPLTPPSSPCLGSPSINSTSRSQRSLSWSSNGGGGCPSPHSPPRSPTRNGKSRKSLLHNQSKEEIINLKSILASIYRHQGDYQESELLYRECFEQREVLLGKKNPLTIQSLYDLAFICMKNGNYEKSEYYTKQSLLRRKSFLGEQHLETIQSMNLLANVQQELGYFSEAKKHFLHCYHTRKQLLSLDHPETLSSLNALANFYYQEGNYNQAEVLYQECYGKRKELFGEDHPDAIGSLNNLANLNKSLGKYLEARELYLVCYYKRIMILGEDHPDTLSSMNNLALLFYDMSDFIQAKEWGLLCYEKRKKFLGENHPESLSSLLFLANLLLKCKELQQAELLSVEIYEKNKKIYGQNSLNTLNSMNSLANLYRDLGKFTESENLYETCLMMKQRLLGETHSSTLATMNHLAHLYKKKGDHLDAEDMYLEVYEIRLKLFGNNHPDTIVSMNNLANFYYQQKKFMKAFEYADDSYERRMDNYGEMHVLTLKSMSLLANILYELKDYEKSTELFVGCYEKRKEVYGENHLETVKVFEHIEFLSKENDVFAKAVISSAPALFINDIGSSHSPTSQVCVIC